MVQTRHKDMIFLLRVVLKHTDGSFDAVRTRRGTRMRYRWREGRDADSLGRDYSRLIRLVRRFRRRRTECPWAVASWLLLWLLGLNAIHPTFLGSSGSGSGSLRHRRHIEKRSTDSIILACTMIPCIKANFTDHHNR